MTWGPTSAVAQAVYDCGFTYDSAQDIIKSRMYPWQRQTGYCWAYDMAAAHMSMIIDCEPFYFPYKKKLWLIELWKGQYGLETGCEIGLYRDDLSAAIRDDHNLPFLPVDGRSRFFNCVSDAERLTMQSRLYRNGDFLFQRGPEKHWWLTGFRWGLFTSNTLDLKMDVELTNFPDEEMRNNFATAMILKLYQPTLLGSTGIRFTFQTPHSFQPASRKNLQDRMQNNNERLVYHYNHYKKWRGLSGNDPNNFTELDRPTAKIAHAISTAKGQIQSTPVGAKVLHAVAAGATKINQAAPNDVVTAYHEVHDFVHKKDWHSRPRT